MELNFEEALEATRASNVFTTHTPVPAGIDLFDPGLMYHYFRLLHRHRHRLRPVDGAGPAQSGQSRRALFHGDPGAEDFRLPQCRQQAAPRSLAGNVARPVAAIAGLGSAITSVTNGVHLPSWLNGDLAALYDQYLQPDWRERFADPGHLGAGEGDPGRRTARSASPPQAPPGEFRARAAALVGALRRQASAAEMRHTERSAGSQRAHHRFCAPLRHLQARHAAVPRCGPLKRILCNKDMPVQIVIAGKAHPKDQPGRQEFHPRDRAAFARSAICGSTWSSSKTTT
jgi:glycogen phosphorylase